MTALVTGGAGFIGSHVADALIEKGQEVHVLDNLSTGRRRNIPSDAFFFEEDIRSEEAAALVAKNQYEVLVHHAAQMDVRRSVEDPSFDADVNIRGLLNLIEAGVGNGLRKVVFASTGGAIYGEPEYTPQDINHQLQPQSPYGVAKLSAEKYLSYYQQQYDLDCVSLRYANVYGPRQNSYGEGGVVAIFAREMLTGEQPMIYGDGEQTRDFVYVDDVVRANLRALSYRGSGVFNVGTSQETSVNTLFRKIQEKTEAAVEEKHDPPKPGEQRRSVLGVEETSQTLGWTPRISLDRGLDRTIEWFRAELTGEEE
jgi:UDP-glucose 4-epimerase